MQSSRWETVDTDILILGSGGAGLFAALHAHDVDAKLKITVATKGLLGKCGCTRMVQGGYNAALGRGDSVEQHFMDTIEGGKWLPDQRIAWTLCEFAIARVHQLENEYGCFFDRNADGTIHQKPFAGQRYDRTVHKGDLTGIEIMNRLLEQVMARASAGAMECLEEHRALALLPSAHGDALCGALLVDMRSGAFRFVRAKATLLATGAGPSMYRYHTPSGDKSMDGLAMALRAGLPLRDMEMVQFHPTGLLAGRDTRMTGTVLEEGLRGAGGHLLNGAGRRFMFDTDAGGERATRDIVSRAITAEMRAGRGTENGGVYLSMGHLGADEVRRQFPGMVKRCADCGFDLAGGRVEVVPSAHYLMGGVVCAPSTVTELPGLFVAGEDAGGAHGANRLGGNGVANATVYGGIGGAEMARYVAAGAADAAGAELATPDRARIAAEIDTALRPFRQPRGDVNALRDELLEVMWRDVGVLRDAAGLRRALGELARLKARLWGTGIGDGGGGDGGIPPRHPRVLLSGGGDGDTGRAFNLSWHDWLNLRNLVDISSVIARAALARENSRGAHYREDFPDSGDLLESYFTVTRRGDGDGDIEVTRRPVEFTIVKPGESLTGISV
ncbi:MAG: FAD-binding protein [Gammaproteobacteria bacterium]|nr:FAD-binding protein [Gammaproteobacteria bacterium]